MPKPGTDSKLSRPQEQQQLNEARERLEEEQSALQVGCVNEESKALHACVIRGGAVPTETKVVSD